MKIDVSNGIDVGCFHYKIESGQSINRILHKEKRYGTCDFQKNKIRISTKFSAQQYHETVIHEAIEAASEIYCNGTLNHRQISSLSHGLAQIIKSLGIEFTYKE